VAFSLFCAVSENKMELKGDERKKKLLRIGRVQFTVAFKRFN